jgi:hypothetical protein
MSAPHQKVDVRASVRYRLEATVVFTWECQAGRRLQGEGITRDISVAGAYILTPTCPPAEVLVQLQVFLPWPGAGGRSVRIKTEAIVIRVEHVERGEGFAVVSPGFTLMWAATAEA